MLRVEDGNHGEYRPLPHEFVDAGVAFIRAADLVEGHVRFDSASRINDEARARIRKGVGRAVDTILSHKGTVGKVALAPPDCEPFVCSPQTTCWRSLNYEQLDPNWLYYYICSPGFQQQLYSRQNESDMADYVSLTAQRNLWVDVPHIRIQRDVARALAALDEKIEGNRQVAALAKSLSKRIVSEDRSRYPSDWHGGAVSGLAALSKQTTNPGVKPEAAFAHFSIPAYDAGAWPRRELGRTIKSTKFVVPHESLLVSKLNPRLPRVWLPDVSDLAPVASTEWLVLIPAPECGAPLLAAIVSDRAVMNDVARRAHGTTGSHQRIRPAEFLETRVMLPNAAACVRLRRMIDPIAQMVAAHTRESRALANTRDYLLPRLLEGRLCVRDAENVVEAVP